jgi:hypothetical protein
MLIAGLSQSARSNVTACRLPVRKACSILVFATIYSVAVAVHKFSTKGHNLTMRFTLLAILLTATAFGSGKISRDLEQSPPGKPVDVIIQWTQPPGPAHHNKVAAQGGALKQSFTVIKAGLYTVPAAALNGLAHDPEVVYISPNRNHSAFLNLTAPTVNAPAAWQAGLDGSGIGVAVIDSGINAIDLGTRVVYTEAFGGLTDGSDQFGPLLSG